MKTLTPSLKSNLGAQNKLHCQYAIDHRGPNLTLEWHKQGERTTLFSYSRHTGQTEGGGVQLKGLADGDASYNLPFAKIINEGTYVCSVSVLPLSASLDISLHIEGEPGSCGGGYKSVLLTLTLLLILFPILCFCFLRVPQGCSQRWPHSHTGGGGDAEDCLCGGSLLPPRCDDSVVQAGNGSVGSDGRILASHDDGEHSAVKPQTPLGQDLLDVILLLPLSFSQRLRQTIYMQGLS